MKKMTLVRLLVVAGLAVVSAFADIPDGCCQCNNIVVCPNPGGCMSTNCGSCCNIA
jgi:hypothetical protein